MIIRPKMWSVFGTYELPNFFIRKWLFVSVSMHMSRAKSKSTRDDTPTAYVTTKRKIRDLALQVEGVSNETVKYMVMGPAPY
jgi:hypothetical protein